MICLSFSGWFLVWKLVLVHIPLVQEIFGLRKKVVKPKPENRGRLTQFYKNIDSRNLASWLVGNLVSWMLSVKLLSFLCKDDDSLENTYIYSCWLGFLLVCFYFLSGHSLYTVEQLCFTNVISECRMLLLYELKISDKWKSTDSIWYMYRYALLFTILTIQRVYIYIMKGLCYLYGFEISFLKHSLNPV